MIILVSDLHLADTTKRKTINLSSLLGCLTAAVEQARDDGVQSMMIVLLGDIFEILKSTQWPRNGVRPWDSAIWQRHVDTVSAIFDAIVSCNEEFFTELNKLVEKHPALRLVYVPGNH